MGLTTKTFSINSVAASSAKTQSFDIFTNTISIYKITVTPSIVGGDFDFEIYKKNTFLAADLLYESLNNSASKYFDPMKLVSGAPVEVLEGFVVPYESLDVDRKINLRVFNNDSQTKNFDITIIYNNEEILVPATKVISTAAITITERDKIIYQVIDTEGAASTDTLSTINGGVPGQMLILQQESATRDITVDEVGNINLDGGVSFVGANRTSKLVLLKDVTNTRWDEVSRSL